MPQASTAGAAPRALRERNRDFYDTLWSRARLVSPERLNTWPLVRSLLPRCPQRLEVAPGMRPRLPLHGTQFLDLSRAALGALARRGASAVQGEISALPFGGERFDLVCALDVVEHVENDRAALSELCRVLKPGGLLLLSVPLHARRWSAFDDFVGHRRRYEPPLLASLLQQHSLSVQQSGVFGMQPRSSRLLDYGIWWLTHHPRTAMRWYNALLPLAVRLQRPLALAPGMIDAHHVDEVIMVCVRTPAAAAA
ncbi:MAG TPA: methyltransferase domain-containing protein [Steroidobacteraceae bacterium]|nr:methyltransferase domain-containing protein [Steroidobacteraceae bacterium]